MRLRAGLTLLASLAVTCCSTPAPQPTPAPPAARPKASPSPVASPRLAARTETWRDAPQTPGDWRYGPVDGGSVARFLSGGSPVFGVGCMANSRRVVLLRYGVAAGDSAPMIVRTTTGDRALTTQPSTNGQDASAALAATDGLLDAMAFSRGRFAVETPGAPTLYLPSWPEVTRAIEDCR
jgi:hypothetical protein